MKIAVILARGGSKRIPNKNIKDFLGRPIISYPINIALKSNLFDGVYVSSDSKQIKDIANKFGAKTPFTRSRENSNDLATTSDALLEFISKFSNKIGKIKYLTCIYPCSPFITVDLLKKSLKIIQKKDVDTVLPIVEFSHPIDRSLSISDNNKIKFSENLITKRTQDFSSNFHDAGMFYTINVGKFIKNKKILTNNSEAIIIDKNMSQDIDNPSDWKLAEIKYKLSFENK